MALEKRDTLTKVCKGGSVSSLARTEPVEDTSTRTRIMAAAVEVLSRSGQTKLSLSDVAAQAGISRPTLYRWFASKDSRRRRNTFRRRTRDIVTASRLSDRS